MVHDLAITLAQTGPSAPKTYTAAVAAARHRPDRPRHSFRRARRSSWALLSQALCSMGEICRSFAERWGCAGAGSWWPIDGDGTGKAVVGIGAAGRALDLEARRAQPVPRPPAPGQLGPLVVVRGEAAHPLRRVEAGRPAEYQRGQ